LIKKTSAAMGGLEDLIWPIQRFSEINVSSLDYSIKNRGYILDILGLALETSLIA